MMDEMEVGPIHDHLRSKSRKSCGNWSIAASRGWQSTIPRKLDRPVGTVFRSYSRSSLRDEKSRLGESCDAMVVYVADRIAEESEIRHGKQFPYQYFAAYLNADDNVQQKIKVELEISSM